MLRKARAFTLLELLASITLLVVLGSMLFEIFGKSSEVVRMANARQEVFQYARASLEFMERELMGAFTGIDADPANGVRGMRIYRNDNMGVDRRGDTQGIFFSAGVMARDTRETVDGQPNPFFGRDVNCARIAYYLNEAPTKVGTPEYQKLGKSAVYRSEMYNLGIGTPEEGGPFVRNCLFFKIKVMDQYSGVQQFQTMDWNSDEEISPGGFTRRRGLPKAIYIQMRITGAHYAKLYRWDVDTWKWFVPGPVDGQDYWGEEDPVARTFTQIVYFGRRSD